MELDKSWTSKTEEDARANCTSYEFELNTSKKTYSIDTPPPYINSPIHIGHATTYTIMDMIARYKRMTGHNVLFPLGLDKNGLPIEIAAEKKFGVKLKDTPREKFLEMCKQVLEEAGAASINSFQRLGIGFNSWEIGNKPGQIYETDSPRYRQLTQETFIDLWNKGLIFEDERLNNYCPGCKTTLADSELERKESPTMLNFVKFKVKETGEQVLIATTRPELLCTAAVVIFNPSDERYKQLKGKHAIVPIFGKEIPIIEDEEAEPEFGTGLVFMSASAGDQDAIRFLRKRNIRPEMAVGYDGLMIEIAGPLKGLTTKKAREKICQLITEAGQMEKQEQFVHSVPICERSKDEIEFIAMREFYLKQTHVKEEMKALAGKLNFYAPESRQILLDWIDSVTMEWPISRRRYYATEVPIWYCTECKTPVVAPKGKYYQPWRDQCPISKCKCGNTSFIGEERVFDTWFDSSNSPLYILQYSRDDEFFNDKKPCSLRPQGKEIIRTWLYYTMLKAYLLTGELIFRDAWINYHVVDDKGHKMSKSKGNVIDPQEILNKFGAEPFRLWCAMEGNLEKGDFRCSFERMEGNGKTIIKLWNVAKFVTSFKKPDQKPQLTELDNWMLSELNNVVAHANERYEKYDFHNPATKIRHLIWETFASHYLELAKNRAYNQEGKFTKEEQEAATYTLYRTLETILLILAPINPMITYRLYNHINNKDVHRENFPKPEDYATVVACEELESANSAIWKAKKDKGLSLKTPVKEATLPASLKPIQKDFLLTHGIQSVKWGESVEIII